MREKTYLNKLNKDFEKFLQVLSNNDGKKHFLRLPFCLYNDGVLFGSDNGFDYIKNVSLDNIGTLSNYHDCKALENIIRDYGRAINGDSAIKAQEVETITEGTSKFCKKALRLTSADYTAYLSCKILGAYPDGAKFFVTGSKNPVAVVYNGEIIKIVCPFINPNNEFEEV